MNPLTAAWMSQLAYDDSFAFTRLKQGGTEAIISRSDETNTVVIAFRGTEPSDIRDWVSDIRFIKSRWYFRGSIHRGFKWAFVSILDQLKSYLDALPPGYTVHLTGHSLGGGLATACAVWMRYEQIPVASLTTFGSPRVVCPVLACVLDEYIPVSRRYVNNNDVVARVPLTLRILSRLLSWPSMEYRHVGVLHYINSKGQVVVNPSSLYTFLDGLWARIKESCNFAFDCPLDGLTDHFIKEYVRHLKGEHT